MMADDPERDLLPVKEVTTYEGHGNVSSLSLTSERGTLHISYITKLDRKELEDRCMCLMVNNSNLKKECNKLEDKIKRLATKLLRLVAEQKRDIPTAGQRHDRSLECMVVEQQQQIRELQQSNTHLQDRLVVLRNQLVEHTSMHSAVHCSLNKSHISSRSSRSNMRNCAPNCRSQSGLPHSVQRSCQANSKMKPVQIRKQNPCQNVRTEERATRESREQRPPEASDSTASVTLRTPPISQDVSRLQEQISILEQDLETQREQSNARISELEDELANTVTHEQQKKVAENIEMIKLQRNLQQKSGQLTAQTAKNQILERDMSHLQHELQVAHQDNDELRNQLMKERQKVSDLQEELQEVESNRQSIRELQEQIRDIQNERSTLKEHNERLLSLLSSRQSQNSEEEAALRSQIAQLENTLKTEHREHEKLMQQVEEMHVEAQKEVQFQSFCGRENNALKKQVAQLEASLATELKERSNLLQTLDEMQQKLSQVKSQQVPQAAGVDDTLHTQIKLLETKLARELLERTEMLQSLEEERKQVAALNVSHNELKDKFLELQARHTVIENQLRLTQQDDINLSTSHETSSVPLLGCAPRIPSLEQSQSACNFQKLLSTSAQCSSFQNRLKKTNMEISAQYCRCGNIPLLLPSGYCACLISTSQADVSCCDTTNEGEESSRKTDAHTQSSLQESKSEKKDTKGSELSPGLETTDQDVEMLQMDELNIKTGEDHKTAADQLDLYRELDKCRELLRVQYDLNSMYKKEVAELASQLSHSEDEQAKRIDELSKLLQLHTTHISKLDSQLGSVGNVEVSAMGKQKVHHLTVGTGEGLFEIHVQKMQFTPEALDTLIEKDCGALCCKTQTIPSSFLTWVFYDQDMAYTPVKTVESDVEFNSSSVHRVTINDAFLEYLAEEDCTIEAHVTVDDSSELVARGTIRFSELLHSPQKKIYSVVTLTDTKSETNFEFGFIDCWFKLSCSAHRIVNLIHHRGEAAAEKAFFTRDTEKEFEALKVTEEDILEETEEDTELEVPTENSSEENYDNPEEVSSEETIPEETVPEDIVPVEIVPKKIVPKESKVEDRSELSPANENLVQIKNIVAKKESSILSNLLASKEASVTVLHNNVMGSVPSSFVNVSQDTRSLSLSGGEEIDDIFNEAEIKRSTLSNIPGLQRFSSITKVGPVQLSSTDVRSQSLKLSPDQGQDSIAITIKSLSLESDSSVMKNPEIVQLYVEYQFLGYHGPDLETPMSIKKPLSAPYVMVYDFRKVFLLDMKEYNIQRNKLYEMLHPGANKNNIVQFIIVSEPLEEESALKDCETVGFAELNLQDLLKCEEDTCAENIPVYSARGSEEIGTLTVTVEGLNTIKKISHEHSSQHIV